MPKIVDHDERRARISAAAVLAIDEQGLDRVRLVDVAKQAKRTTGAVSHYFPDKEAVLAAALEHVLGNLADYSPDHSRGHSCGQAPGRVKLAEGADPVERFIQRVLEILPIDEDRRRNWRVWIAFCGRAVSTPALAALHCDAYAEVQQAVAAGLEELGLAAPGSDAHQLAVAVFAAFDGLGLRATLEPDQWPPERLQSMLALQLNPLLRTPRNASAFETTYGVQEKSA